MSNDEIFFKWSPDYSVNIKAIDDQHQELVNILNRLFVAVSKREGDQAIAGILDALVSYTQTHFALEERLMRQAKYKDLEPHIAEHKKLLEQLDQLAKKHMLEEKPIYFEMLAFLKSWLKVHIQGVDMKYSTALQQAGFSVDAWEREATAEFATMSNSKKWWEVWKAA
ncbi:MAG: hemerythrin family protein [Nitrosomonadales bacterium]|nr:hemerythrin family protein [Nitrosomonadales bacterium]